MQFEIINKGQACTYTQNVIYLYEDNWNDWFHYVTMFHLVYVDGNAEKHELGSAKFGQFGMSDDQVVLLTLTCLIASTVERTLILIDEPENHLHPPLLSAFIRALSELLIRKNGLAIIATHSPVILQEVPRSCVQRLSRVNSVMKIEKTEIETFGESIQTLTNEVFGLEVTHSGFHKLLLDAVNKETDYHQGLEYFNFELGSEARALLRLLLAQKNGEDAL